MSDQVFGRVYADQYDLLYSDKDYEAECDILEEVFRRYGDGNVRAILDLGCGTGNHAVLLGRRGYQVIGVDRSADMIRIARDKAKSQGLTEIVFKQGDIRDVDLGQTFDVVLMMFAVLGYQLTNDNVLAVLRNARRHLRHRGILVFDVWYGPAVLTLRPSDRVKLIPNGDERLLRVASGRLDVRHHICEVTYHLFHLVSDRVKSEVEEVHRMRYFFPMELELFLSSARLEMVALTAFPHLEQEASDLTWNVLIIARAKDEKSN